MPSWISLGLSNGLRISGAVRIYMPEGRDRVSDWARHPDRFRYIESGDQTLLVNVAQRPVAMGDAVIDRESITAIDRALEREPQAIEVFRMGSGHEAIESDRARRRVAPEDAPRLLRRDDVIVSHVPFPVAHHADALRVGKASLILVQVIDRGAGPQHVANPMTQDWPVNRLGNEICGADFIRMVDRINIVKSGHHHNRCVLRVRALARICPTGWPVVPAISIASRAEVMISKGAFGGMEPVSRMIHGLIWSA